MGRKEDEEDQGKLSKDTNGSCIEELTKKCKPLNVQLNRLELPKNGIVLVKDDSSDSLKEVHLNRNEGEISYSNFNSVDKNEDNSNDTAETIKKIKEFIASGRCEESRKDQESSDKKSCKSKLVAKRKLLHKKDSKTNQKSSNDPDRLNVEHELERTLKGNDSSICANYSSSNACSEALVEKKFLEPKQPDDPLKIIEHTESSIRNHELLTTPSRVSKRIQSKSVKFSVKKMLRGDDVNVLKRMIPGYQDNTPTKKERLTEKKAKIDTKKLNTPVKSPSPLHTEPSQDIEQQTTPPPPQQLSTSSSENTEQVSTPIRNVPSSPESPHTSMEMLAENKEKLAALSDKIGKFAIGNGKITVELKGSQQKKVVRIAIPPVQSQSSLPNTSLGPDIIIKRVKPVKKTVVMPDDPSLGLKGIIEKEVFLDNTPTSSSVKDVKLLPRVNLERISTPKLKENLVKMHKNIMRHGRNEKNIPKELKLGQDKIETNSASTDTSLTEVESNEELPSRTEIEPIKISEVRPMNYKDNVTSNSSDNKVNEVSKAPLSEFNENVNNSLRMQDESKKSSSSDKTKSRKTAKVTPLAQVKSKNDSSIKKSLNKIKKSDTYPEKSQTTDEFNSFEPEKETYNCLFDRYFSTRERYIQHNDSLDSDSSEECNDEIYAHFINLRKRKEAIGNEDEKKDDALTMYDLMQDISVERPTWNIHVTSDGQAFCLAQVDIVDNVPVMKKVIEIDLNYNAKVFVGGTVMPEFEGNYSGYDDIRQLIYEVDQL